MNPLWNSLVVAGIDKEDAISGGESKPFLGTVDLRGVAYQQNYMATGLGAMILQVSHPLCQNCSFLSHSIFSFSFKKTSS